MGSKASDIEGTRDDNTMNIEGEGADQAGGARQTAGDEELVKRSEGHQPGRPRINPCQKYGHHPKFFKADDGNEYECDPRVCRHCQQPY